MTGSAERPGGRVPDFFIVGHPKSGTTALYEMLRRHPQIFMADLKEPRFFASDLRARAQPRASASASSLALPETLEEYLSLFDAARPGQRVGEASPSYLRSATAARAIAEVQPGARVIAILREPASFLSSLHLELVQNHVEQEQDLRKALANDGMRLTTSPPQAHSPRKPSLARYGDRVHYVEQLRRYHAVFPPEQVLVLIYDDFRADNEATLRTVLRFLAVDDSAQIELSEANPSVHVRSLRADRLLRGLSAGRGPVARTVKAATKTLTPTRLHRDGFQALRRRLVYGAPRPPEEALMRELRCAFEREVLALSEYLGRDLVTLWGYDLLG
jgi:Sulfotransferase family